jgi:hypothetical protein
MSRVGGNGSAIYNPKGRINTAGALRGMVVAIYVGESVLHPPLHGLEIKKRPRNQKGR